MDLPLSPAGVDPVEETRTAVLGPLLSHQERRARAAGSQLRQVAVLRLKAREDSYDKASGAPQHTNVLSV